LLKKALTRKIVKVIPLWLVLVMLLSGSVSAIVLSYISNPIKTSVTVTSNYITLNGAFTSEAMQYDKVYQDFTYSLNGVSKTTGLIHLYFSNHNGTAITQENLWKIQINAVEVYTDAPNINDRIVNPSTFEIQTQQLDGKGGIWIVIGCPYGQPYTFQTSGNNMIHLEYTYEMSGNIDARMQIYYQPRY
jgi:hypothetical protein